MGLDMYIRRRSEDKKSNDEELAYWRKANAIHRWFVINVQDNDDDCSKKSPVTFDKLRTLLLLCKTVKDDPSRAAQLLPTTNGFFFGSTEYSNNYFADIDSTIEQIEKVLNSGDEAGIYYQSSW